MDSPPRILYPDFSWRPSINMAPVRLSSWIWDRVRVSRCRARKTSRRRPRSSGSARSLIPYDLDCEQHDADRNGGVSDIERRPGVIADVELEEVDNVSIDEPVIEIAQCTAEDQGKCNMHQAVLKGRFEAVRDNEDGR